MIICNKEYCFGRYSLYTLLFCILLCTSCEWVNDDLSGCKTGTWLHFTYTYNILDVDATCNQVDNLSILLFDSDNKFLSIQEVDSIDIQEGNAYVEVLQPAGEYRAIVWGDLSDSNYSCSQLVVGETDYEDVTLALSTNSANVCSSQLGSLFYGGLDTLVVPDYYNIIESPLVKNTNSFSIIIQDEVGEVLKNNNFEVVIQSDNGVLDYKNNPVANNLVTYTPYEQYTTTVTNTSSQGVATESTLFVSYINTLQLLADEETTLSIIDTDSGDSVVELSLIQYLLMTNSNYASGVMSDQEYLDRQDSYSLIFFIDEATSLISSFSVNGWVVRLNAIGL